MQRKYNVGGFTFGDNASNGIVQYHTYDDVINNNIKLPVSGDPEKLVIVHLNNLFQMLMKQIQRQVQ